MQIIINADKKFFIFLVLTIFLISFIGITGAAPPVPPFSPGHFADQVDFSTPINQPITIDTSSVSGIDGYQVLNLISNPGPGPGFVNTEITTNSPALVLWSTSKNSFADLQVDGVFAGGGLSVSGTSNLADVNANKLTVDDVESIKGGGVVLDMVMVRSGGPVVTCGGSCSGIGLECLFGIDTNNANIYSCGNFAPVTKCFCYNPA